MGSAGASALAELVSQSKTLEELWQVTSLTYLFAFKHVSQINMLSLSLRLNKNFISRDGVECLIKALKMNSRVKEVW